MSKITNLQYLRNDRHDYFDVCFVSKTLFKAPNNTPDLPGVVRNIIHTQSTQLANLQYMEYAISGFGIRTTTLSGHDLVCPGIPKVARVANLEYLLRNDYLYDLSHTG